MTTLTSSLVFTVTNILAEIVFKAVNGQNQVFLDPSARNTQCQCLWGWALTKRRDNIVVAYMVADMEVDMVADIDINMEIQFDEWVGHGSW